MMNDLMLDIETFGTDSNSVVISISAVQFNLDTGMIGATFEQGLQLQEQIDKGCIVDMDTVMWWMSQSKEAQNELLGLTPLPVEDVLHYLNDFCNYHNITAIWGNGATFDNVIVRNLFKRFNMKFDIGFWADRDVRTLVGLSGINPKEYEFKGIKHDGIDDCLHQIKYCVDANKILKGGRK